MEQYFNILGIKPTSNKLKIKFAYKWQLFKNPMNKDTVKFYQIQDSYNVIMNNIDNCDFDNKVSIERVVAILIVIAFAIMLIKFYF